YFSLSYYAHHLHLHSFPTRRSSDLTKPRIDYSVIKNLIPINNFIDVRDKNPHINRVFDSHCDPSFCGESHQNVVIFRILVKLNRSEEHTSELQSRENLVCRLLLEKK